LLNRQEAWLTVNAGLRIRAGESETTDSVGGSNGAAACLAVPACLSCLTLLLLYELALLFFSLLFSLNLAHISEAAFAQKLLVYQKSLDTLPTAMML
jgi:hypothetical protein